MEHLFIMKENKKYHKFEENIVSIMNKYNLNYTILYNSNINKHIEYMHKLDKKTRIYLVGGDGTIHAFLQCLVGTIHEIVIIPFGTGNDFIKSIYSIKDPIAILEQSIHGTCIDCDVMNINNQYFINSCCFAFDSVVANYVHEDHVIHNYLMKIIRHIFTYKGKQITVLKDNQIIYQGTPLLLTINNGIYYGGGFGICPHSLIDDHKFDLCIVDLVSLPKIIYLFILLLRKKHLNSQYVHYYQDNSIHIISSLNANLDGEVSNIKECDIKISNHKMHIIKV